MDNNRWTRSRGILGPRPSPLKISKDSHKIVKKPPLAPQPQPTHQLHQQEPSQPPPRGRGPVIIYDVSPKIIHTHPNNFMSLVQRLTGKTSTPTSRNVSSTFDASSCGLISPAARYAATEKANTSSSNEPGTLGSVEATTNKYYHHHHQNRAIDRPSFYHGGILSSGPTSLPMISPDLFSTVGQTDPQALLTFYNDFNSIFPSTTQSPSSMEFFNNFFDS